MNKAAVIKVMQEVAKDRDLLEIGRKAVEDELVDWRESRLAQPFRGNGLVVREKDGTSSDLIRFGPEIALKIGLQAIAAHLEKSKP